MREPDFMHLLFVCVCVDNVLVETNWYGDQYVESHQDRVANNPRVSPHDFVKQHISRSKLLSFFVLVITMGIVDLPSVKDCWSTSWPFLTPQFSKLLSRVCFLLLLKFLHLADNTKQVARSQPGVWQAIQTSPFHGSSHPPRPGNVSPATTIDEVIISYKGWLSSISQRRLKSGP